MFGFVKKEEYVIKEINATKRSVIDDLLMERVAERLAAKYPDEKDAQELLQLIRERYHNGIDRLADLRNGE